jgi:alkanesulfonate monooxygenase
MTGRERQGQLKLGVFFNHTGHHVASWRHPRSQADAGINFEHYRSMTTLAEAESLDFIFFADSAAIRETDLEALSRCAQYTAHFEPLTLLGALAVTTARIGLAATATTSYNEPYHVARKFASLDHLSKGRAGWNVVTSGEAAEAYNFGRDAHFGHLERYRRAAEFVEIVQGLWDSWDDDAFVRDRASGRYFDPDKVHRLNHSGEYFKVRGPLNVPRPPQGHPVIFQAGSSGEGRSLGARFAEVTFTGETEVASATSYYKDLKSRAAEYGRGPDDVKILPGLNAIVAPTAAEAREQYEFLQSNIDHTVGISLLSTILQGVDLRSCDPDGPLPNLPEFESMQNGVGRNVVSLARRENLSVRELYRRVAGSRGKRVICGSPSQVADEMQTWFEAYAADGFILQPAYLPGALEDFCRLVLPVLRDRGLFRTEYQGTTLREHLGLKRPVGRFTSEASHA